MTRARFRLILALGGLCGAFVAMSGARAADGPQRLLSGCGGTSAETGLRQSVARRDLGDATRIVSVGLYSVGGAAPGASP